MTTKWYSQTTNQIHICKLTVVHTGTHASEHCCRKLWIVKIPNPSNFSNSKSDLDKTSYKIQNKFNFMKLISLWTCSVFFLVVPYMFKLIPCMWLNYFWSISQQHRQTKNVFAVFSSKTFDMTENFYMGVEIWRISRRR